MKTWFSSNGPWQLDVGAIAAVWAAIRLPLLVFGLPPLVQVDSFCYRSFWDTLADPHYPFLYGQFLALLGPRLGVIVQHMLVLASALVFYAVARSVAHRVAGLLAGIFVAAYGGFVLYAHSVMSEILLNFFLALHLGILWPAVRKESAKWFFGAGVMAGLATTVRPVAQYQVLACALALAPCYFTRERVRIFARLAASLVGGFLLTYLPVAALTWQYSGEFTLSTGLPKAVIYRLVSDNSAPLSQVQVDDPTLAAIRDYLASESQHGNASWYPAYLQIRTKILGVTQNASLTMVDPYVMRLWRRYVLTYPGEYLKFSFGEMLKCIAHHETLNELQEFSQRTLQSYNNSLLASIRDMPTSTDAQMETMDTLYQSTARYPMNFAIVICVLFASVVLFFTLQGPERRYIACLYATMAYIFLPQFLVSICIWRYRYPFDLVYCLVFGIVCARLVMVIGKTWRRGNSVLRS